MKPIGAVALILIYIIGLAASLTWAASLNATYLIGLTLWTSFFGFCTAVSLMAIWSREHWMG